MWSLEQNTRPQSVKNRHKQRTIYRKYMQKLKFTMTIPTSCCFFFHLVTEQKKQINGLQFITWRDLIVLRWVQGERERNCKQQKSYRATHNKAASRKIMRDTVKLCGINAAPNGKLRTTTPERAWERESGTETGSLAIGIQDLSVFFIVRSPVPEPGEPGNLCPQIYERPLDYEARRKQSNGYNKQF